MSINCRHMLTGRHRGTCYCHSFKCRRGKYPTPNCSG